MKKLSDIKMEIKEIENLSASDIEQMKPIQYKRMKKKLELLRLLVIYLETSPTENFVRSELSKMENIISSKMLEFKEKEGDYEKLTKKEVTKLRKAHETKYDIPKMRVQVRNLRLLLK